MGDELPSALEIFNIYDSTLHLKDSKIKIFTDEELILMSEVSEKTLFIENKREISKMEVKISKNSRKK